MHGPPLKTLSMLRAGLNKYLFADPPSAQAMLRQGERLVVMLALLALAVILQLFRIGPWTALNSLWAEDGPIFLQGAISQGFMHDVFSTYAGYLVFVPRLVGEVGALAPLRYAPAVVAITSSVIVALSGLAVWYASAAYIRHPYLRGTLVAVTILVPVSNIESVASGAYVPWYMLFASFWLLLWRPSTTRATVLSSLFILATGLSSPGLWFFAPLAALRAIAARERRDLIIVGSFVIGAAVQVPILLFNNEGSVKPMLTINILTSYIQRVVDGAALGEHLGGSAWAHFGWPFLIVLLLCVIVGFAFSLLRSSRGARYFACVAIFTSLMMFVIEAYQRATGTQMMWPAGTHFGTGGRYTIVPALLLVSAALVLIDHSSARRRGPSRLPWAGFAAVAILLLGLVGSFDVRDTAERGTPPWVNALQGAATACVANHLSQTTVATSPPGWGIVIPCDQLSSFATSPP